MKQKQLVLIYGKVVQPVLKGMSAIYFSNGTWKETARVKRVVEVTEEHIKFETDRIRYCIEFRKDEAGALLAAAQEDKQLEQPEGGGEVKEKGTDSFSGDRCLFC